MKHYSAEHLSAVEVVNRLISEALQINASDIHLEPTAHELTVRFRVDGTLLPQDPIRNVLKDQVISRIKLIAHIDIAEHRMPQDGGLSFSMPQGTVDLRVSTFPGLHGQKIVVRILNRSESFLHFNQLGLDRHQYDIIKKIIDQPQGLFLVTGPTGSGKTTTLYALLDYLNTSAHNIVTLEDPVEYRITGITQGNVHERIGFSFAQGIRSILRQDPDIIMVGEIRDNETAHTAIRAALTGHLVLSTLHTNDAPSAIIRLMDMGIEPYLINASLTGVLAQRLVRVLCTCKSEQPPEKAPSQIVANHTQVPKKVYAPTGCGNCHNTGYKSRCGIFECMPITEEIKNLIIDRAHHSTLARQAQNDGMKTLQEDALSKLRNGTISLADFMRIGVT